MKVTTFLSFILVLTTGWMQFYAAVREQYNGLGEAHEQVAALRHGAERHATELALERERFVQYRQDLAVLMPDLIKEKGQGEKGYPYRSLASTLTVGHSEELKKTIAKTLFERGQNYFNDKKFAQAIKVFQQVIDRYGYSPFAPEAYFLMAESHYQEGEVEEATTTIQQMIELFPLNESTGFALVRLGKIYEAQNRREDATDIYRAVLRSFPQRDVASQAKASMRNQDR